MATRVPDPGAGVGIGPGPVSFSAAWWDICEKKSEDDRNGRMGSPTGGAMLMHRGRGRHESPLGGWELATGDLLKLRTPSQMEKSSPSSPVSDQATAVPSSSDTLKMTKGVQLYSAYSLAALWLSATSSSVTSCARRFAGPILLIHPLQRS